MKNGIQWRPLGQTGKKLQLIYSKTAPPKSFMETLHMEGLEKQNWLIAAKATSRRMDWRNIFSEQGSRNFILCSKMAHFGQFSTPGGVSLIILLWWAI